MWLTNSIILEQEVRAMADHATVVRVARFRPTPGKEDDLLTVLRNLRDAADAHPSCFGAQVCSSQEDSGLLVVISRWADRVAVERFRALPTVVTGVERAKELVAEPSSAEHFMPIDAAH
jgi:quinol monooxygenase YgiN